MYYSPIMWWFSPIMLSSTENKNNLSQLSLLTGIQTYNYVMLCLNKLKWEIPWRFSFPSITNPHWLGFPLSLVLNIEGSIVCIYYE